MVNLAGVFGRLQPFPALVLGDFMLDTYTMGKVGRISPEAPVPVMEALSQESRPGGAGNVVMSLKALGADVTFLGRVGDDAAGVELQRLLGAKLLVEPGFKTPVKNRLIADSQQLLRIDFETVKPLSFELEERVIASLKALISQVKVLAISDYGKGFLTERILAAALQMAKEMGVRTIVDPKGTDFAKYKGASVLKPNLSEAYGAAKLPKTAPLDHVAKELSSIAETLLITRAEAGISIFDASGVRSDFPVRSKEVKDVTGAGDTVLAMICLGLANGLDIQKTAQLANLAAGLAIERLGCVQITLPELAATLLESDFNTKIFDESHVYALRQVLKGKRYVLFALEKERSLSYALFQKIRQLSTHQTLIVYVKDAKPEDEFVHLLSSLHEVSCVILQTENLKHLCSEIHPHEVYLWQNDEAKHIDQAKELLASLITPPPKQRSLS